jgi:TRAP-type C4-dicarboxylate transport system substrate-binding protein
MQKRLISAVAVLAAAVGFAGAEAAAQAPIKISYGTYLPPTHVNNHAGIEPFAKRVEQETGGKVKFEIFTGGSVAPAKAAIDQIRDKLVTAGMIVDSYVNREVPYSYTLTELALQGRNALAMAGAVNEMQLVECKGCLEEQKKAGFISTAYYSTAPYVFMCKTPLVKAEDMKGRKVRATAAFGLLVKAMGGVPVNITSDEVYEAMQRGQAECNVGADAWLKSYTLWDVAKAVTKQPIGTYHGGQLFAINAEAWNSFPADVKAVIKKNLPILAADVSFGYLEESKVAQEGAASHGVKFVDPDPSLTKAYEDFLKDDTQRVIEQAEKRGVKNAKALVETFIEKIAKWEKIVNEEVKGDKAKYIDALNREVYSKVSF